MRCDEYRAAYLGSHETEETQRHLSSCASCRAVRPSLERARRELGDPSLWEEPSPELEAQTLGLIGAARRHRESTARSGAVRTAARIAGMAAVVVIAVAALIMLRSPAPDWEVAIGGTDLAPLAGGTVSGWNVDSGTRVALDVTGLPPAPSGFVYEFWFSKGPIHLSAGSFTTVDDVELWIGVARSDYPRLWVTLEPIDEDTSPSSQTVLDTG